MSSGGKNQQKKVSLRLRGRVKKGRFFCVVRNLVRNFCMCSYNTAIHLLLTWKKNRSEEFQWIAEKESSEHEKATLKVIRDERGRGWIECCAIFKISFFPSLFKSSTQLNIINILKRRADRELLCVKFCKMSKFAAALRPSSLTNDSIHEWTIWCCCLSSTKVGENRMNFWIPSSLSHCIHMKYWDSYRANRSCPQGIGHTTHHISSRKFENIHTILKPYRRRCQIEKQIKNEVQWIYLHLFVCSLYTFNIVFSIER